MQNESLGKNVDNLIQVSAAAREELLRLGGEELRAAGFLRIAVVPGGCTGLTYEMGIDAVQTPFDRLLYRDDELKVVTDGSSFRFLKGLSIDYSGDLVKAGFRFLNPNAASSCGCGSSFAVQEEASG
jgi:iron-sulfur cluster assembly accessory protein